ncbi:MAG: helix-turn-helix transcriptional regulator [Nitrosomonadales bacterium]|nr:helix-turn-helix transcriptional regulator [Nitrosomonadales bacterium]
MSKSTIRTSKNQPANSLREVLATNIRQLRREMEISQEELAFRCDLDRTYISAVERCVWNVSLGNIEKIATALDTEPWRLLLPPK